MSSPRTPWLRALLAAPKRWLATLAIWPIALLLLFEEWGWEHLEALMRWLAGLPGLRQIEALIRRLPPYGALALFAVPVLALLPVKLLALYWISQGHAGLGLLVILGAKLGGTAIVARLFALTQPTLMRLAWFARWYPRWLAFKNRVMAQVRASLPWRTARRVKLSVRRLWQRWQRRP